MFFMLNSEEKEGGLAVPVRDPLPSKMDPLGNFIATGL